MVDAINTFRTKMKEKYNDPTIYDDKTDLEIAEALARKYPDAPRYQELPDQVRAEEKPAQPLNKTEELTDPRTYEDWAKDVGAGALETTSNLGRVYPAIETALNMASSFYGVPLSGLAGAMALPLGLDKANKVVQKMQELLVYQPQTKGGEQITKALAFPAEIYEENVARPLGKAAEDLGAPMLGAAIHSTASAIPALMGAKGMKASAAATAPAVLKQEVSSAIKKGLDKAKITPLRKASSRKQLQKYYDDAEGGVAEIIKNREKLEIVDADGNPVDGVPNTLDEFSQAIDQTQTQLFKESSALANDTKAKVNLKSTIKEVKGLSKLKTLKTLDPETLNYARMRIEALKREGSLTPLEAQEFVQFLNQTIKSYNKDGSMVAKGRQLVDTTINNQLRKELNTVIENATGKDYGALKKKWGQLNTIREDVSKAALRDSKKTKTLGDYSDIYTGSHIIAGLARRDPTNIAIGLSGKGISLWYKHITNPNARVEALFSSVAKYMEKPAGISKKAVAGVAVTNQIAQAIQDYDDGLLTDTQIEAFQELRRRGLIHYPKETSDYLRGEVQKEVGVKREVKRKGYNKSTKKKVIEFTDGTIEDDDGR